VFMAGNIKSKLLGIFAGAVLMLAPAGTALAGHEGGYDEGADHVTICHALGNGGYNKIAPSASGVFHGHLDAAHGGQGNDTGDIIPTFTYKSHSYSQNWDTAGMATFNNNCVVPEGGHGGGCDQENGRDQDCTPPQKDCDGDFDSSAASECQNPQPQMDCDSDFDSSPATECTTGGQGGGPTTTTTTTTPQVLGASTTQQVAVVPTGSVNGGEGAASRTSNSASLAGLMVSLVSIGAGLSLLNRRQN
jgi:hypothetical protein